MAVAGPGALFSFATWGQRALSSPPRRDGIRPDSQSATFIEPPPESPTVAGEPPVQYREVAFKVVLVGEEAVGKTSLVRRFVVGQFSDHYKRTLGTVVHKKVVNLPGYDGRPVRATMMVWDIEGRQDFLSLVKQSYFKNARGVIAVCDSTRPETLLALQTWLENVRKTEGEIATVILANKMDLPQANKLSHSLLDALTKKYHGQTILASAKTGLGVEEAFSLLATSVIGRPIEEAAAAVDPTFDGAES